ncbi:hypothetical protein ABT324_16840 [Saccharopolyspora sp. NPDC000359]|uniref:hypothetical protein n=1 Tax=Saccharopolyspora sp. NPDC000359 TaxID=3154251 RepID=UPI003330425B
MGTNPLIKPKARGLAAGLVGLTLTASTFLGAGTAHAVEPLVVDTPLAIVDAVPGQQVVVRPSTLDFKVREAVLLAMPLAFGKAKDASERFAQLPPITLGAAPEGRTFYSGKKIAEAAGPRLAEIGLPEDAVDSVRWHFTNLVAIGNAVTVRAKAPEEEAPPPPPPSTEQPPPPPPPSAEQPPPPPPPEPSPELLPPDPRAFVPQPGGAPSAVSVLPPELRGSELAWLQGHYGQAPGMTPNIGDLVEQNAEQRKVREEQDEVRAAGRAEALPTEVTERVAVPVLLASIALAIATAALVRSWVLRRS